LISIWLQHLLVLLIVAGCLAVVGWQTLQTLWGRKSRIGSCCAKGCDGHQQPPQQAKPQAERVVFLAVEMLTRRK
jgi:hypothetical protein